MLGIIRSSARVVSSIRLLAIPKRALGIIRSNARVVSSIRLLAIPKPMLGITRVQSQRGYSIGMTFIGCSGVWWGS